jgi:hypothetical protein
MNGLGSPTTIRSKIEFNVDYFNALGMSKFSPQSFFIDGTISEA